MNLLPRNFFPPLIRSNILWCEAMTLNKSLIDTLEVMMANIFEAQHDESPVTVIRQTMSVSLDDDGVPVVTFATNRGKGSGAQSMPVTEFRDYVSTLSEFADNGIPEGIEENLSAAESLRRTIQSKDGIISFRVKSGKGAKPAKVPTAQLGDVAKLLTSTIDAVEAAAEALG